MEDYMDPKIKITAAALWICICTALAPYSGLWLWGVAAGAVLLFKFAIMAVCDSETDPLTGLWNLCRLEHRRRHYARKPRLTVLYLDLDDLKQINDTQGHRAGNEALQAVACALVDVEDDAYRIGGDEFLLISTDMDAAELEDSWRGAAQTLSIRTSFGIAEGSGTELDDLIARADGNMYRNK